MMLILIAFMTQSAKKVLNLQNSHAFLDEEKHLCRRFDEGSVPHQYEIPRARYRHAYFEVLELAAGEVDKRFDHEDLHTMQKIEELLFESWQWRGYRELSSTCFRVFRE